MSEPTTHRADRVCIDEQGRKAVGTLQWLLENEHVRGTHSITPDNALEVLMCGEEGFGRFARDIEEAADSIDLICWGFDPGMELVRNGRTWPRGQPYGSWLLAAAAHGAANSAFNEQQLSNKGYRADGQTADERLAQRNRGAGE